MMNKQDFLIVLIEFKLNVHVPGILENRISNQRSNPR